MVETMFNCHHPTSITTSSGSGKAQVNSAPIGRGGLHIFHLDLSGCLRGGLTVDVVVDEVMALSSWNIGWEMARWSTVNGEEKTEDSGGHTSKR
jgi:hypothetical protein